MLQIVSFFYFWVACLSFGLLPLVPLLVAKATDSTLASLTLNDIWGVVQILYLRLADYTSGGGAFSYPRFILIYLARQLFAISCAKIFSFAIFYSYTAKATICIYIIITSICRPANCSISYC